MDAGPSQLDGYMARKYFGTDGIRGLANGEKLTPDLAMRVGQAAGMAFRRGDHRHRVVIGKDTRRSGYMLEYALQVVSHPLAWMFIYSVPCQPQQWLCSRGLCARTWA